MLALHLRLAATMASSQYDAGTASVTRVSIFFSNQTPFSKSNFFDILIGWTQANAEDATLELNLSQL